jgi:chromosome segregation ATPase
LPRYSAQPAEMVCVGLVMNCVQCFQATLNGIDSVAKVLQYFREQKKYQDVIDGYYGVLIENFECDKTFFTAVEVTAGNR